MKLEQNEWISNCCGSHALGEINNGTGMCSDCKDHAVFGKFCDVCDCGMVDCDDLTKLKCDNCGKLFTLKELEEL